jgi:hypothetical protein
MTPGHDSIDLKIEKRRTAAVTLAIFKQDIFATSPIGETLGAGFSIGSAVFPTGKGFSFVSNPQGKGVIGKLTAPRLLLEIPGMLRSKKSPLSLQIWRWLGQQFQPPEL